MAKVLRGSAITGPALGSALLWAMGMATVALAAFFAGLNASAALVLLIPCARKQVLLLGTYLRIDGNELTQRLRWKRSLRLDFNEIASFRVEELLVPWWLAQRYEAADLLLVVVAIPINGRRSPVPLWAAVHNGDGVLDAEEAAEKQLKKLEAARIAALPDHDDWGRPTNVPAW